jgi:hypothetical protein
MKSLAWRTGVAVKVRGMSGEYRLLGYVFLKSDLVELALESADGIKYVIRRRRSQVTEISEDTFEKIRIKQS